MLRNIEQIKKDLAWLAEIESRVKPVAGEPCDVKTLQAAMQKAPEFDKRSWSNRKYAK